MKKSTKIFVAVLATAAVLSGCSGKSSSNSADTTTTSAETTIEATTESANYEITIPYSCFYDGVPDEDDLVITATESSNGVVGKTKLGNGGMLLIVEKDKYDNLLAVYKSKIDELVTSESEMYDNITKSEISDDYSVVTLYETIEETQAQTYAEGAIVAESRTAVKATYSNASEIAQNCLYYQSLIKMTDTTTLTCTIKYVNADTGETISETKYPTE